MYRHCRPSFRSLDKKRVVISVSHVESYCNWSLLLCKWNFHYIFSEAKSQKMNVFHECLFLVFTKGQKFSKEYSGAFNFPKNPENIFQISAPASKKWPSWKIVDNFVEAGADVRKIFLLVLGKLKRSKFPFEIFWP